MEVSRGNPGLQDLIGLRLVYNEQIGVDRAEAAVASMETYLTQGALPAEPEIRAFLENLALDTLLDEAGASSVALLRAATLFDLPVPVPVIDILAANVGGSVTRLRGLGLLDAYEDLYAPSRPALHANPLAAGRLTPLTLDERTALAAVATSPLFAAWGGEAGWADRDGSLDLQLTQLALLADNPVVVAACAADAVTALRDGPAANASRLGQAAIELLDRYNQALPLELLRRTADAAITSGDGESGTALLARAAKQAEANDTGGTGSLDQARVIAARADHLITQGELDQAERLLHHACELFTTSGSETEAAVAMGSIADIAYRRGDYEEALRVWREVQLPVFERLRDAGAAAVTWGRIADIAFQRGDYEEALRIRRGVQLPVYERLGDLDSIAAVTWKLAQLDVVRQDYDSALPRLIESFQIFGRLQRPHGIAAVGTTLGQLLLATGETDAARQVLNDSLAAATKLGWTDMVRQISELLSSLPPEGEDS